LRRLRLLLHLWLVLLLVGGRRLLLRVGIGRLRLLILRSLWWRGRLLILLCERRASGAHERSRAGRYHRAAPDGRCEVFEG
jgi:hypothetical protein